jgi:hypothetical protein
MHSQDHVAIGIKVIKLFDSASYSTTYKMATMLGLIDVIKESVVPDSEFPTVVKGSDVADKVFEYYWPQSVPYPSAFTQQAAFLKQSPQRDLPQIIAEYRTKTSNFSRSASIESAEFQDPNGMKKLRREVRQRILKMPIPRLQKFGSKDDWKEDRFLFDYNWAEDIVPSDDSLHLKDGIAESLMKVRPLLRPYVETLWANYVADRNPTLTDASNLRNALFGKTRTNTTPLREPLRALQGGACFYCSGALATGGDVDHFFAFTHFNNEDLDNFVLSCFTCNNSKSAMLPALSHLSALLTRNSNSPQLDTLAASLDWPRGTHKVGALATLAYLVETNTVLWKLPGQFELLDLSVVRKIIKSFHH